MSNTKILTHEFEYLVPGNLDEALKMLDENPTAALIAGGTDVIPQLKYQILTPKVLVNLMQVDELNYINHEDELRIGAAVKLRRIEQFCRPLRQYRSLYEALYSIGKVQVLNMATLAGNLCTASPAADSAPALLVLGAKIKLANLNGQREIDMNDFFTGPRQTIRGTNEIMTEIIVPAVVDNNGNAFSKMTRVGSDISKISCAVAVDRQNDTCISCKIAMGAVAPTPIRITTAEALLTDRIINDQLLENAAIQIAADIQPQTDVRSTETYRRHVAKILFKTTFNRAWKRAGSGE